jgi:ABC-type taurine transport system ATPase subunit
MGERRSFWQRLFGGEDASSLSQRQQKVMRYLIDRMDKGGVPLQQALQEDYVRRNLSRDEVRQIVSHPEFVQAARERLGESFRSDELKI